MASGRRASPDARRMSFLGRFRPETELFHWGCGKTLKENASASSAKNDLGSTNPTSTSQEPEKVSPNKVKPIRKELLRHELVGPHSALDDQEAPAL